MPPTSRHLLMYPLPPAGATGGADPFLTRFADSCREANIAVDPISSKAGYKQNVCFVHWPHHWNRISTLGYSLGIGQPYATGLRNKRTIWDVHDLVDHRTQSGVKRSLLVRYYKRLYLEAHAVVVHEQSAIEPLTNLFGERSIDPIVARFGPFDVFHGAELPKDTCRSSLNIPANAQVFLLFGTDRENRRHDQVVNAFLSNSTPDQFLCVGGGNDGDAQVIARDHNRIRFFGRFLENEIVRDLFCASDFVIEHGVRQLTSGVVRTAISYGKPVVSRDFGCSSDMASGAAVWLSDDNPMQSIFEQLSCLPQDTYESMALAARTRNLERPWSAFGEAVAGTYDSIHHA